MRRTIVNLYLPDTELPRHSNLTANKAINNLNMVPPLQVNTLLSNKVNMVPLLQALLQDSMGAPLHNSHTANKGNILLLSSLHMASSHRDINSLHMGLQLLQQVVMAHLLHNNTPHSKVMELLSNIPNLPLHPQAMVQCNTSHMTESQTPKLSKRL